MNYEEAIDILKKNEKLDIEEKKVYDIDGYVSVEDIRSDVFVPERNTSMRDGYALKYKENGEYILVKNITAGAVDDEFVVKENEAVYVATGGIVPEGCDRVVMIEYCEVNNGFVKILKNDNETWIRYPGSDVDKGEIIIEKGVKLNYSHIGLLISVGIEKINVYKKPKIIVVSTGNEVKNVGETLKTGEIYDVNRPMILKYLQSENYFPIDGGIIDDETGSEKLGEIIESKKYDVIITSGGVSVGKKDFVRPTYEKYGTVVIDKLNMKPGKPFIYVKGDNMHMFGLPGNPVSSIVSLSMFVKPFLSKTSNEEIVNAIVDEKLIGDKSRFEFMRGMLTYDGSKYRVVKSDINQNSSCVKSIVNSNGLICLEANSVYNVGDVIKVVKTGKIKNDSFDLRVGIITLSDRAYNSIYDDISGQCIVDFVEQNLQMYKYKIYKNVLPDDKQMLEEEIIKLSDSVNCRVILTTGGTGPDWRDNTVEVTEKVIHKILPGFGEIMRMKNFDHVKTTILSGQMAGIRYYAKGKGTLIVNLPGKPESINECLSLILPGIKKCIPLISKSY